MSFNTAKIINVYYKADRKPYDANGKPISYFGEDFNGANEATEIRFYMPEGVDLGAVDCVAEVKRANGDKRFDLLTKVTNGDETYYRLVTNAWYNQFVGKVTIAFKAYFGGVTIVDGVITSTNGAIYVSDIFHLQIAYAPSSTEPVPPFDPTDVTTFINALSAKLNVNNGIFVIASALPSLANDVYDGQWFLVKNNTDGEQGRLYYIDGSTAIAVELELGKLKLTPTGNGDLTTNTGKLNWEQPNGTVQLGLYNDVNIGLGEDVFYYGKASANITKGQAIQFAGYQGDHLLIKPAVPSEINANPKLIMGIAKHNITSGDFGYVLHFGKLDGVDTGSFQANQNVGIYEEQVVTLSVGGISPPTSPSNGDFWFSSSNLLYERVAGAWVLIPGALYGTSLPQVTNIGVYFVNTSTNKLFLSTYQQIVVAGDLLWFASGSGNNGELTATKPTSPNAKILMAAVIKAETSGPANNGVIQVRITIEPRLTELQDVEITNIQNNDVLKFNATTQQWENTNAYVLVNEELNLLETRLDTAESDIDNIESAISNVDNTADLDKPISTATQSALNLKADLSYVDNKLALKADASALATKADLVGGKVPASQLPGFVDDVIIIESSTIYNESNPIPDGVVGSGPRYNLYQATGNPVIQVWVKPISEAAYVFDRNADVDSIYVNRDTNITYRLSSTVAGTLVEISASLALGETSSTAYRGDRGKTAYDHSQSTGNPHGTTVADIGAEPANANIQSHISSTSNPHGVTVSQIGAEPANANIQTHISSTSNPHSVTKAQVGLGNVDNTSDLNKPISTATQTALNAKADLVNGKIPTGQLPAYVDDVIIITSPTIFATIAALQAAVLSPSGGNRRYLVVDTTPSQYAYSIHVYLLPANTSPSVIGNFVLEKTIGKFNDFTEIILDYTNNSIYKITGFPWDWPNGGSFVLSNTSIETNSFFQGTAASFALEATVQDLDVRRQNIIPIKSLQIYSVNNPNDFPNTNVGVHIIADGDIGDSTSIWKKINTGSSQSLDNWQIVAADTAIYEYYFFVAENMFDIPEKIQYYHFRYEYDPNTFEELKTIVPLDQESVDGFRVSTPYDVYGPGTAESSTKLEIVGKVWNPNYFGPVLIQTLPVVTGATLPEDFVFGLNGNRLYYLDNSQDRIYQCNLSVPYQPTAAEIANPVSNYTVTQDINIRGIDIKPDGTRIYVMGSDTRRIIQINLNTPWNLTSVSTTNTSQQLPQSGETFQAIRFSSDGSRFYVVNSTDDTVEVWDTTVAWDISSSITFVGAITITAQETSPTGLCFNADGTKMFVVGSNTDSVFQYTMNTAFGTSATYDGVSFNTGENTPTGIMFNGDGSRIFVIGSTTDSIKVYGPLAPGGFLVSTSGGSEKEGFYFKTNNNPASIAAKLELGYQREVLPDSPIVHFTHDGKVGVATDTPTQSLDVNGPVRLRGLLYDGGNLSGSVGNYLRRSATGVEWAGGTTYSGPTRTLLATRSSTGNFSVANLNNYSRIEIVVKVTLADTPNGVDFDYYIQNYVSQFERTELRYVENVSPFASEITREGVSVFLSGQGNVIMGKFWLYQTDASNTFLSLSSVGTIPSGWAVYVYGLNW